MTVDHYELFLAVAGVAALLAAWLPAYVRQRPLSLPIFLVALGLLAFALPTGLPRPDPRRHLDVAERFTEAGVIVALTGAGLKIDRPIGWRRWATTWRMLAIAMPVTIGLVAVLGGAVLGLTAPSALLLGAVLAPTDPVLASDVQVGEPTVEGEDEAFDPDAALVVEDDVRFTLTGEGGLNDALAFPFVYAAIRMLEHGVNPAGWLAHWVLVDVLYRLAAAVVVGVVIGRLLGLVLFRPPGPLTALAETSQGFVAVAATLLTYGATELVHGYGFLAVFIAAVVIRASERSSAYHSVLHGFSEQAENLLVVGLLVAFGGAIAGGLLRGLRWTDVLVAALVLLVARPLAGLLALRSARLDRRERWAIAFFGVRGIGSLYYLAYALSGHDFTPADTLWRVTACTILGSVVVHGIAATPTMRSLDRRRDRRERGARLARRRAVRNRRHGGDAPPRPA